MKMSLPDLNNMDSDHKNHQNIGGSGITPSYFPALMNMAILAIFRQG